MVKLKIDVLKIDKALLFKGAKGTYLDCCLIDKPNDHGDDGFITQDVSKEAREAGERGPIIGNWRHLGRKSESQPPRNAPPAQRQGPPQRAQGRPAPQRPENDYTP